MQSISHIVSTIHDTAQYYWTHHSPLAHPSMEHQFNAWLAYRGQPPELAQQVGDYIVSRHNSYVRIYQYNETAEIDDKWELVGEEHFPHCAASAIRQIIQHPEAVEQFLTDADFPPVTIPDMPIGHELP